MNDSILTWALIGISFTTYFIISMVYKKLHVHNLQKALETLNGLRLLNLKHLVGIVLFGIVFYLLTPELKYLIEYIEIPRLKILILIIATIFLCAYLSKLESRKFKAQYESGSHYDLSNLWLYIVVRLVFLFAYEFFFRGVLLFKFLEFNPLYLAVVYSTILYMLIHIFDSKKEILGALPFGIVLCLFTYYTKSIWYAFLIHASLSAVYEISLFYNQTLKITKS